jgi:hypothetical protein
VGRRRRLSAFRLFVGKAPTAYAPPDKRRGIFLRYFEANLWSLPWEGSISGGSSHIEILHNNVHHIGQSLARPVGTEPGGNDLGIGVYGTDATRGLINQIALIVYRDTLGMPANCFTMRAVDISAPFRES